MTLEQNNVEPQVDWAQFWHELYVKKTGKYFDAVLEIHQLKQKIKELEQKT
tara:strand:- start:2803 stop:2955 length:153 start_codon:yes stop_codon:yes gene_type:complete